MLFVLTFIGSLNKIGETLENVSNRYGTAK